MNTIESKKDVVTPQLIFLDKDFNSQSEIINFIVDEAVENGRVSNPSQFYQAVIKREEEVSTAIGYSIAIPHGKTEAVQTPFISFVRLKKPIQWNKGDEEKVQLIFLIGVPEESEGKLHLRFISQLSRKLLDDEFRKQLLTLPDVNKIFEQLSSIQL